MNKMSTSIHVRVLYGHSFQLLWVNIKQLDCWIVKEEYIEFHKTRPTCLPKWLYHFTFICTGKDESSCWSNPHQHLMLPVSWILAILICVQQYLIVEVPSGVSFHMFICHLSTFLSEGSMKNFGPLFDFFFLLLSFKSSSNILDNSPLSDMSDIYFAYIFFWSLVCFHSFGHVFNEAQLFNFNEVQPDQFFLSLIRSLVLYLRCQYHMQCHIGFILCQLLGVLYFAFNIQMYEVFVVNFCAGCKVCV